MSHSMSHLSQPRRASTRRAAGLLAVTLGCALGACAPLSDSQECAVDEDCFGAVCSRDGACAPAGSLISARIAWTLCAGPATVERCDSLGVTGLRVTFMDLDTGDEILYEPVLCELGQIYFDRMSPRYDALEVALFANFDRLDNVRVALDAKDNVFDIDLAPQSPTDPLGCAMLRAP